MSERRPLESYRRVQWLLGVGFGIALASLVLAGYLMLVKDSDWAWAFWALTIVLTFWLDRKRAREQAQFERDWLQ